MDSLLDKRIEKRAKKRKRSVLFRVLFIVIMVLITIACVFYADYNMNEVLDYKSLIEKLKYINKL